MNDPNDSSGFKPQTLCQSQEHFEAPGVGNLGC
jgi:hypothetical protein